jgi:hypothetical protein
MAFTMMTPDGPAACRECGAPATVSVLAPLAGGTAQPRYYCEAHHPDGPPCPLCGGSGRLHPQG